MRKPPCYRVFFFKIVFNFHTKYELVLYKKKLSLTSLFVQFPLHLPRKEKRNVLVLALRKKLLDNQLLILDN